jgi:hypothetical protein
MSKRRIKGRKVRRFRKQVALLKGQQWALYATRSCWAFCARKLGPLVLDCSR